MERDEQYTDRDAPRSGDAERTEHNPATGTPKPREIGGQEGPEPTRYGDWEKNGRCTDF